MKKINLVGSAAVGVMAAAGVAHGVGNSIIEVDLNGWQTWGGLGSPNNTRIEIDVSDNPEAVFFTGVGWDLTIASIGSSWNSEVAFDLDGSGITLTPGTGQTGTGSYSSGGIIKFTDANLDWIVIQDQTITIEVFETFDDPNNTDTGLIQDANLSGTLFLQVTRVPAPGALAVLGITGLVGFGRRRRA